MWDIYSWSDDATQTITERENRGVLEKLTDSVFRSRIRMSGWVKLISAGVGGWGACVCQAGGPRGDGRWSPLLQLRPSKADLNLLCGTQTPGSLRHLWDQNMRLVLKNIRCTIRFGWLAIVLLSSQPKVSPLKLCIKCKVLKNRDATPTVKAQLRLTHSFLNIYSMLSLMLELLRVYPDRPHLTLWLLQC